MEEEQTLTQDISEAKQQHHAMRHSNSKYKNALLKHQHTVSRHLYFFGERNWTVKVIHRIHPAMKIRSPLLCI
jgi:hypothetical protein